MKECKGELLYEIEKNFFCFNKNNNEFLEIIDILKPDILFITKGNLAIYALYAKFKAKYRNFKIIITLHNPLFSREYDFIRNFKRVLGSLLLYRFADKIVTISDSLKAEIIKLTRIPSEKIYIIPNPIITEEIKKMSEESIEIKNNFFVAVGRLVYQKGYDLMIDIFRRFLWKFPKFSNIKLIIIGDGPEKMYLVNLVRKFNLEERVIFYGVTSNPYKFMKNSVALLLTSRYEGFPTVLIEASYLGCPFIAFNCKYGPKEIQRFLNWGFVVEFGDKEKFIENMYNLLTQNRNEKDLMSINYEKFIPYTMDNSVNEYIKLFKEFM